MFRTLGWINAGLLLIMLLPWIGTKINQLAFSGKNRGMQQAIRMIRRVHKPAGILLVVLAFFHGYLAVGRLIFHTGTVLYAVLLLTAIFGIIFWRIKNRRVFQIHKFLVLLTTLLFLLHWLTPGAFRGWL